MINSLNTQKLLPVLRRLQGERTVLERQIDLYAKTLFALISKDQLLVALKNGLLIDPTTSLIDTELYYLSLKQRVKELEQKMATTRTMMFKLLDEIALNKAVIELGLDKFIRERYRSQLKDHEQLLLRAQTSLKNGDMKKLEQIADYIQGHIGLLKFDYLMNAFIV